MARIRRPSPGGRPSRISLRAVGAAGVFDGRGKEAGVTLYTLARVAAAVLVAAYVVDVITYTAARIAWRRRRSDS
jgi:hypothetical protein